MQDVTLQRLAIYRCAGLNGALKELPPPVPGANLSAVTTIMKHEVQTMSDEPVGIVISRGWEPETAPRFSAYVWAPWPDDDLEPEVVVA